MCAASEEKIKFPRAQVSMRQWALSAPDRLSAIRKLNTDNNKDDVYWTLPATIPLQWAGSIQIDNLYVGPQSACLAGGS